MDRNSFITVKKAFFDQKKVMAESDKLLYRGLSKLGAFIRRTIQFSMKSKKGASPVGTPPNAHGKKYLKKYVFFNYDNRRKSMVVGPTKLQRTKSFDVPRVQEKGEVRSINSVRQHKTIVKRFPKRPYTAPAAEENMKKLRQIFSMNKATRR